MNKIVTILFLVLTSLGTSLGNSEPRNHGVLYGVDNVQLPNDSLVLMNSLLVDYQVDYDIALATKNPGQIVSSLHKIGLVYLKLGQFDLAANYGWRLLNVSNKYELGDYQLFAYALLYRVYKDSGKVIQANKMFNKYQNTLVNVQEELVFSQMENEIDVLKSESNLTEVKQGPKEKLVSSPVTLADLEKEAKMFDASYVVVVGLIGIIGLWLLVRFKLTNHHKQVVPVFNVPDAPVLDVEHIEIKDELVEAELVVVVPEKVKAPVPDKVLLQNDDSAKNKKVAVVPQKVRLSNFQKLLDQTSELLSSREWKCNVSIMGKFKNFSDQSYSGILYILESLSQKESTQADKEIHLQWIEVPKGMVLNISFHHNLVVWNRKNFEEWTNHCLLYTSPSPRDS